MGWSSSACWQSGLLAVLPPPPPLLPQLNLSLLCNPSLYALSGTGASVLFFPGWHISSQSLGFGETKARCLGFGLLKQTSPEAGHREAWLPL